MFAGQWGPEGLEYANGHPASSALVTVLDSNGDPAVLYTDRDRSSTTPNPTHCDDLGNLYIYAEPGDYTLNLNGRAIPIIVPIHPGDITAILGGNQGWLEPVNSAVGLVQIHHGLPFRPAGITCLDSIGRTVEYDTVSHPVAGITEVTFGHSFGPGTILLS